MQTMSQQAARMLQRCSLTPRSCVRGTRTRYMSSSSQPIVVQSPDAAQVSTRIASLLTQNRPWQLSQDGRGIQRAFVFKTFNATWVCQYESLVLGHRTDLEKDFMTDVAGQCQKARHHPEWSNRYNKTVIRWTTHDANALTAKDVAMADFCDEAGQRHGELDGQLVQDDIAPRIT